MQHNEAKFRALLENSADIILLLDKAGQIVYCNAASESLLGHPPAELVGQAAFNYIHPEDQASIRRICEHLIETPGEIRTARARVRCKDGTWKQIEGKARNLLPQSHIKGVAINCRDITDEMNAQEDLRNSKQRFVKAFRSSPLATTISTLDEGRYLDVNDAFLQMVGYQREEVIGKTVFDLGFWVDPELRTRLLEQLKLSSTVKGLPASMKTRSGSIREANVSAELIELEGLTCMLAITQDVTETRHLEEQVRKSQKMEAIGRLAGGIAHDFNNMLSVIMGYSDLCLEHLDPTHPASRNLSQIKKAAVGAAGLTRQLLAFSRQQILFPKVLDLNAVINNLNDMLARVIGEDVSLFFKPAKSLGPIVADLSQVQQILMNLVVNARDAMPTGGQIFIETANIEIREKQLGSVSSSMSPGNYVMFSVSDTGCGMDKETMARIFDPFFTTKGPGQGTGLGLSTVYGIVKQSNGYIWVYSEPGKGATFKVYFPRDAAEAKPEDHSIRDAAPLGGSETVLVVEDDEILRALTVAVLESAGYEVLEAPNAEQAIGIVEKQLKNIDVVLTDVVLPGMSGRKLSQQLLATHPNMKILLMSGYAPELIERYGALELGVSLIEKPFTRSSLLEAVSTILDKKHEK